MKRLFAVLLLAVCLAAPSVAEDTPAAQGEGPAQAAGAEAEPEQEVIDAAVARGVAWLREEQKRDGAFGQGPGETALALLTLRHAGVATDDRACSRAARYLERELPDGTVYGAALGALALLAQDERLHRAKVSELLGDLVAAQCENGQWSYGYRTTARKPSGDNSNSQFAVLALAAGRARGLDVPKQPFAALRTFLNDSQNADGGFGYSDKERSTSYASMTAGGAMSLAFAVAVATDGPAGDTAVGDDPNVRRALDWLAANFDAAANTGAARSFGARKGKRSDAFWRHYWLWSVERAGAATGREEFGEHRWYAAGCRVLLERQLDDGQWRDPERELLATCFAILFFRRSTHRAITPRDPPERVVTPTDER